MQYKIVRSMLFDEFEEEINQCLDEGWVLYGYPIMSENVIVQALTFSEKPTNPPPPPKDWSSCLPG